MQLTYLVQNSCYEFCWRIFSLLIVISTGLVMASVPKRDVRYDTWDHPLTAWNDHTACRSCLHFQGVFCTRNSPCPTCASWTPQMWKVYKAKRLRRQCESAHKAANRRASGPLRSDRESRTRSSSADSDPLAPELMPPPPRPPSRTVAVPVRHVAGADSY